MKKICPRCKREYKSVENFCTRCGINRETSKAQAEGVKIHRIIWKIFVREKCVNYECC